MPKLLKVVGYMMLTLLLMLGGMAGYILFFLPNTGQAPKLNIEITEERVERGRYLANNVAVCMDCHSTRNWNYFSGPPQQGTLGAGGETFDRNRGFPGVFYALNITPYKLHNWTDGEIYRAITTGVSKDGSAIFPVMPYKYHGQLDPEDVYCIIAYLRTLAPIPLENKISKPDFPANLLMNLRPQKAQPLPKPSLTDSVNYGRYLVTAAGCAECHSPVNKQAKVIAGKEFRGGRAFIMPGGIVRSANLTPDESTGLGRWSAAQFVSRFKAYSDTSYHPQPLAPDDFNSPMPWTMYAHMTEADLRCMFHYLRSLPPVSNAVQKFSPHKALAKSLP